MSSEKVRIRIAVVVDSDQNWSAIGNCIYESDEETAEAAIGALPAPSPRHHVVWVEAEVPLPNKWQVEPGGESE